MTYNFAGVGEVFLHTLFGYGTSSAWDPLHLADLAELYILPLSVGQDVDSGVDMGPSNFSVMFPKVRLLRY